MNIILDNPRQLRCDCGWIYTSRGWDMNETEAREISQQHILHMHGEIEPAPEMKEEEGTFIEMEPINDELVIREIALTQAVASVKEPSNRVKQILERAKLFEEYLRTGEVPSSERR